MNDFPVQLVLVGDIPDGFEDSYKQKLLALVDELGIQEKVIFAGAQTPEEVRNWYSSATIALNLAPEGLFDKAALESMACGVPTIVSNPAFHSLIRPYRILQIPSPDDIAALRESIKTVLALSHEERNSIGQHLRQGIIAEHSLDALVKKLISVMTTGD